MDNGPFRLSEDYSVQLAWHFCSERGDLMKVNTAAACADESPGRSFFHKESVRMPWKLGPEEYIKVANPVLVWKTLDTIKNNNISILLASAEGRKLGNTTLMTFDGSRLLFELPIGFDLSSVRTFRAYFKDEKGIWSFFEVKNSSDCSFVLCTTYPSALYCLQRRLYPRFNLPIVSRTSFWRGTELIADAFAIDVSQSGMLISTNSTDSKLGNNDMVSDITVFSPATGGNVFNEEYERQNSLPVIGQGWVVRSFRDRFTNNICHGISFEGELIGTDVISSWLNSIQELQNDIAV